MKNMKGIYYVNFNVFLYPIIYQDMPEVGFSKDIISPIEKSIYRHILQRSLGMKYLTLLRNY
jgi:hypothetical protein